MLASQTDPFDPDRSGLSFYGQWHYISRLGHLMARKQKAASVQASPIQDAHPISKEVTIGDVTEETSTES
jgi:hypothetical protein